MKRIFLALAAVIICMIQPVNADTLWTCIPESGNPSTKMLFITVADDKISVFDVSGKEILVAPFAEYRNSTTDGIIIQARFQQHNELMYSFSIAANAAGTEAKVMFALTANDTTVFWNCT